MRAATEPVTAAEALPMKAISITAISSRRSAEQAGETGDLLRTQNVKYFHAL